MRVINGNTKTTTLKTLPCDGIFSFEVGNAFINQTAFLDAENIVAKVTPVNFKVLVPAVVEGGTVSSVVVEITDQQNNVTNVPLQHRATDNTTGNFVWSKPVYLNTGGKHTYRFLVETDQNGQFASKKFSFSVSKKPIKQVTTEVPFAFYASHTIDAQGQRWLYNVVTGEYDLAFDKIVLEVLPGGATASTWYKMEEQGQTNFWTLSTAIAGAGTCTYWIRIEQQGEGVLSLQQTFSVQPLALSFSVNDAVFTGTDVLVTETPVTFQLTPKGVGINVLNMASLVAEVLFITPKGDNTDEKGGNRVLEFQQNMLQSSSAVMNLPGYYQYWYRVKVVLTQGTSVQEVTLFESKDEKKWLFVGYGDNCDLTDIRPGIVPREYWCEGCEPAYELEDNASPTHIILHHTDPAHVVGDVYDSYESILRSICTVHIGKGWGDIGYHYLIAPNGIIYEGRKGGPDKMGVHTCDNLVNEGTIGVSIIGDYTSDPPSESAQESLKLLLSWLSNSYSIDPETSSDHLNADQTPTESIYDLHDLPHLSGHRDACARACPGEEFYDLLPSIRTDVLYDCDKSENSKSLSLFDETNLNLKEDSLSVSLYPNPAFNTISFSLSGFDEMYSFSVVNMQGIEVISTYSSETNISFSISNLPIGIYLVKVSSQNKLITKKFIKQ